MPPKDLKKDSTRASLTVSERFKRAIVRSWRVWAVSDVQLLLLLVVLLDGASGSVVLLGLRAMEGRWPEVASSGAGDADCAPPCRTTCEVLVRSSAMATEMMRDFSGLLLLTRADFASSCCTLADVCSKSKKGYLQAWRRL